MSTEISEAVPVRPGCTRCGFQPRRAFPIADLLHDGWTWSTGVCLCDDCSGFLGILEG